MAKEEQYSAINSTIGSGSTVSGTLKIKGGLRIDGFVEGEVYVNGTLTVGHEGRIKGDVSVTHAVIGGTINGTVKAEKQLELQNGSRVEGDIITKSLVIEEGVFFEGHCSMSGSEKKPKQKQ